MKTLLKVEGNTSLERDVETNAIINTNQSEYEQYMKSRETALGRVSVLNQQGEDINMLKQDMAEIKQMLSMLVKSMLVKGKE
jgi:hypothetical protein